jgi:hypothetical protein
MERGKKGVRGLCCIFSQPLSIILIMERGKKGVRGFALYFFAMI